MLVVALDEVPLVAFVVFVVELALVVFPLVTFAGTVTLTRVVTLVMIV